MKISAHAAFFGALLALLPATAPAQGRPYAELSGWSVTTMIEDSRFTGCVAIHNQLDGAAAIALAADGRGWMLAFEMATIQGDLSAELTIDGRRWFVSAVGVENRVSTLASDEIMGWVRAGSRMTISVQGVGAFTTTLIGSSAAMDSVINCVRSGNQQSRAAPAPVPQPQPQPQTGGGYALSQYNCPNFAAFPSATTSTPATLRFANASSVPLTLYWIDYDGVLQPYTVVQPGITYGQPTYLGHNWVARTADGFCMGGVMPIQSAQSDYTVN